MLSEFLSCKNPIDDQSPCNYFLGRALARVYDIHDFDAPGGYMSANAIAVYVKVSGNWTKIGDATNQDKLTEAQGYANLKKPVIAVRSASDGHGHVAMILPGELSKSGIWNLMVPNSAAFLLDDPKHSYVGKGLAYAFGNPQGVEIYGRNTP
jgi:hypothetical protein